MGINKQGSAEDILQIDAVRLQPKISQIRDYDAYGKEIFNVVYLHTAKPGFTGKELDAEGVSTEGLVGDVGVRGLGLNYFGKRFYDSEIGRWVGCDPKGQFFSSYAYAGNGHNPIGSTDPDGAKIRFDNNASPEFKAEFARAVRYLNKNNSSSILAKLEARSETITLRQGASLNDVFFDPSANVITWNPFSALKTTSGGTQTPALGVLHEADHALESVTNPKQYFIDVNTVVPAYGNLEEKRVITGSETGAAIRSGEGTRSDHSGSAYKTNHSDEK